MQPSVDQRPAVVRRLDLRSAAVGLVLVLLAVIALWAFRIQARTLDGAARLLAVSGRQGMLVQRGALLAAGLEKGDEAERREAAAELVRVADRLAAAQRGLRFGDPRSGLRPVTTARILRVYLEEPHDLEARLFAYVAALRRVAAAAESGRADAPAIAGVLRLARPDGLPAALEAAVAVVELEVESRLRLLRTGALVLFALELAVLAVLLFFVLRPSTRALRLRMRDLQESRERLRQRREELRLILENAPVGIATFDPEGRFETVNQAFCSMLGVSTGELRGRPLTRVLHPDDAQAGEAALRRVLDGAAPGAPTRERYLRGDGSALEAEVRRNLERAADGSPLRVIAHVEDRTERQRAEREVRQQRERLAHLSRLNIMGEMAAGIAHEINQPLTAVANYAQACRRLIESGRTTSGDLLRALEKISGQASRAGEVIRRLRTFLKRHEFQARPEAVNAVVGEAVELAEAEARFRGVGLNVDLASGLPRVTVDSIQIQQVILNLIRNGMDSLEAAGRRDPIVVSTRASDAEFVEVRVVDRGAGLRGRSAGRIFEPFFTTKESGMGMGLSISRTIISSHGGRIWCSATPDGGTSFHFTLPIEVEGRDGEAARILERGEERAPGASRPIT